MTPQSYVFSYLSIVLNPGYSLKSPRSFKKNTGMQTLPIRGSDSVVQGQGPGDSSPDDLDVQPRLTIPVRVGSESLSPTTHTQTRKNAAGQMPDAEAEQLEARLDAGSWGGGCPGSSPGRCG